MLWRWQHGTVVTRRVHASKRETSRKTVEKETVRDSVLLKLKSG